MMPMVTIHFGGMITPESPNTFRNLCLNALLRENADELLIMLSSTGGNVRAGITIYEYLRTLPVPVTMCNVGAIESIACIVYLGADTRIAMPNTHFKFHGFDWTFPSNNVVYSALADAYFSLNNDIEQYADIFEKRTHGAEQKINIRECLRGKPLIIRGEDATPSGMTTSPCSDSIRLNIPGIHLYP